MQQLAPLFESFTRIKVGVIGDVMLDTYMWGEVERISPEAPVPIVTLKSQELRIGGAGNVALNARSMGAQASILTVTGDDEYGEILEEMFRDNEIGTDYIVCSNERITTNKIRVISRNQQMMRLDTEMTDPLSEKTGDELLSRLKSFIIKEKPDIIIFEDYNKGVLTDKVIREAIALCKASGVLTAVDPKQRNFFNYKGVDIFKPNLKEVKEGLGILIDDINIDALENIHLQLQKKLEHRYSLITLSEHGVFYAGEKKKAILPSHFRNIADVSGAGDTVIAAAALVFASSGSIHLAAEIANIAGGLVCEEVGTVAVDRDALLNECEILLS